MSNRYDEHMVFHVVYFIQNTTSGHIKIGTTKAMGSRLNTLQNASADPLLLMASMPGDHRHEAEIHDRFRSSRLHREWFAQTPELLAYIGEIAQRGMRAKLPAVVVAASKPRVIPPLPTPEQLAAEQTVRLLALENTRLALAKLRVEMAASEAVERDAREKRERELQADSEAMLAGLRARRATLAALPRVGGSR